MFMNRQLQLILHQRLFRKAFLPVRPSKIRCALIIVLLLCIYFLDTPPLAALMGASIFNYVFLPLLWLAISLVIWSFPRLQPSGKLRLHASLNGWAFIFAFIFIVASLMAGLFDGLGRSPYSHTPAGIALNLFTLAAALLGRELARSYLINSFMKKENYFIFTLMTALITFIDFPFSKFADLGGYKHTLQFIAKDLAPEFSKNFLASYLAFLGGPPASMIYMGTLQAFHWFSPILPNLKWITTALVGILTPTFSLMAMQYNYASETRSIKIRNKTQESPGGWMATCILSIGIIWFSVGVFPVYPSVIATGSMKPMIHPGDVILVRRITDIGTLKVGDVVQFGRDDVLISHRIVEIVDDKGVKSYRTQGDNNSRADYDLVAPKQIKGLVIDVVPKIGWPTLLMKKDDDIPLDQMEF